MKRARRPPRRREKSTQALKLELETLIAKARALTVAASEQLATARGLREELQAEAEAGRHMPLIVMLGEDGGRMVH
jgi:hypothetical protein